MADIKSHAQISNLKLHTVVQLILIPFFNTDFFNIDFITWIVTFYQLTPVATGVMHEADNAYSIRNTLLCYRLVRFLIHMLIIAADFVALY